MRSLLACAEVVSNKRISFSMFVLEGITDEMRKTMGVDLKARPYESGANSAVFDNDKNNVVSFSTWDKLYSRAKKVKDRDSEALPKVYRIEKFELEEEEPGTIDLGKDYIYAIEMQKLNMLDKNEAEIWNKFQKDVFSGNYDVKVPSENKDFVKRMLKLKEIAENNGVEQTDMHSGNVAKDDNGNLKFIDLELVNIG